MNKTATILVSLCALLMLGCESAPVDRERSTAFVIPTGSTLVLHQPLTIPAETASILIQDGKVAKGRKVRQYHPHCRLEVLDRMQQPQTVQPDTFVAVKVTDFYEIVQAEPAQVAQLDGANKPIILAHDASATWNYITEIRLESARQPNVLRLQCMQWNAPPNDDYVTVGQIRAALGDIMTLELAS